MPPLPKPAATRARTNRVAGARTLTAVHDRKVRRSPLPKTRPWLPETRAWWRDLWTSPMAPEYDDSDRHGLLALAMLVDDFWAADDPRQRTALAAEIRLQRQCFGLTPIDRRRLQWEIDRGDDADRKTRQRRAADVPRPVSTGVDPRAALMV